MKFNKLFFFGFLTLLISEYCYARAGGATSHSSGGRSNYGGFIELLYFIGIAVWAVILGFIVYLKKTKTRRLLRKLAVADSVWDEHKLTTLIETAYFKIQESWKLRNPNLAREFMSECLYSKHLQQAQMMLQDNLKPMMFCINLKRISIVEVTDFNDNNKDKFTAHIVGSMVDYVINEITNEQVAGNGDNETFRELWSFIRFNDKWLLDEIHQDISASELLKLKNKIEAPSLA